jgi:lipopolysaccharide export system permease protein
MILSKYIFKQTLTSVFICTLVFLSVVWLSQSFRTINFIIDKGANISDFFILSAYSFPNWLVISLPFGTFAGCMISYLRLDSDKEIIVMKAAGINTLKISKPAIYVGLMSSAILFITVHFILPLSYKNFKSLQNEIRNSSQELIIKNNIFVDLNDTQTIYVGEINKNNFYEEIFIQDRTDSKQIIELFSKNGFISSKGNKLTLYMNQGTRISTNENNNSTFMDFKKYNIEIKKNIIQSNNDVRVIEYNEYNFFDLIKKANKDIKNQGKLLAEAHNRNTMSLLPIVFTIIAMISTLTGYQSRKPSIYRKIISISVLILIQSLIIIIKNKAHFNLTFLPIMYLLPFSFIIVGFLILYKNINLNLYKFLHIFNFKRNII